jgi:hypothetical protein
MDTEKIIAAHKALTEIITNNPIYFANKDASDVADDFIEAYANDKKLPYKEMPNIEVDNAISGALQLTEI